jgi:hypothetical protein
MTKEIMPYNTSTEIFSKLLSELKMAGRDGVAKAALWKNIGSDPRNSYTLTLLKFLDLVSEEGSKVKLTKLGIEVVYAPQQETKNALLIKHLPDSYMTMIKWIFHNQGEMSLSELKVRYINNFDSKLTPAVIKRVITTFLNHGKYIGLLEKDSKANIAVITQFGKKIIELNTGSFSSLESANTNDNQLPSMKQEPSGPKQLTYSQKDVQGGSYLIRIQTVDRDFIWDIKTEADLAVVDAAIKAIKESWLEYMKKKTSSAEKQINEE